MISDIEIGQFCRGCENATADELGQQCLAIAILLEQKLDLPRVVKAGHCPQREVVARQRVPSGGRRK